MNNLIRRLKNRITGVIEIPLTFENTIVLHTGDLGDVYEFPSIEKAIEVLTSIKLMGKKSNFIKEGDKRLQLFIRLPPYDKSD